MTDLGSSKSYPKSLNLDKFGFLSSDKDINPLFYKWSKAFIPYCDGSLHQGSKLLPI